MSDAVMELDPTTVQALQRELTAARSEADAANQRAASLQSVVVLVEQQVARAIEQLDDAIDGDVDQRLELDGPLAPLGERLNELFEDLTAHFKRFRGSSGRLLGATDSLQGVAVALQNTVVDTAELTGAMQASADDVNGHVHSVASAAEEMSASITQIASNADEAAQVARKAVEMSAETSATIGRLGEASNEIGAVSRVISAIAQQTNLLALNAAIEAARAGAAGRGFAVVANEVKDLADETARATQDIQARIDTIQGETRRAVSANDEIASIIAQISGIQESIAHAVDEQSQVMDEISRSATTSASGTSAIVGHIHAVADRSHAGQANVQTVETAVVGLRELGFELDRLIKQYS